MDLLQHQYGILLLCLLPSAVLPEPVSPALTPPLPVYLCHQCSEAKAGQMARQYYRAIAVCRYGLTAKELAGKLDYAPLKAGELTDPFVSKPAEFYQPAPAPEQQFCADVSQGLIVADASGQQLWWYHNRIQDAEQQLPEPLPPGQTPLLPLYLQQKTPAPELTEAVQQLVLYSQRLLALQQQVTTQLQQQWQHSHVHRSQQALQQQQFFGHSAALLCLAEPAADLLAAGLEPYQAQQLTAQWRRMFSEQLTSQRLSEWQHRLLFTSTQVYYPLPAATQEIDTLQLHWPAPLSSPALIRQNSGGRWHWQSQPQPDWTLHFSTDWQHSELHQQPLSQLTGTSQQPAQVLHPCLISLLALHYHSTIQPASTAELKQWQQSRQASDAVGFSETGTLCRYQFQPGRADTPALRPLLSLCPR